MKPQQISGSTYEVLGIQERGRVLESNGVYRDLLRTYYYGPSSSCSATPNGQGQKKTLVTTPATGFQAVVTTPMIAALNKGWINGGIWAKWMDSPTDPWEQVSLTGPGARPATSGAGLTVDITANGDGAVTAAVLNAVGAAYPASTYVTVVVSTGGVNCIIGGMTDGAGTFTGATFAVVNPGTGYATGAATATQQPSSYLFPTGDGAVGSLSSRLPLDNNVTIRRYTQVRGKNWKGNLRPTPIDKTHATDDQLNLVGQAAWKPLVGIAIPAVLGMYASISDGDSTLVPILISPSESQMIRYPTRIAYAPMQLPGLDPVTGQVNPLIDLALGESKRRKERKSVTF